MKNGKAITVNSATNDAEFEISTEIPYRVALTIEGTASILFHRYSVEAVAEKAQAKKGSVAKKTDNIESYIYRDKDGNICLPGEYVRQSIIAAAKSHQDPRSPRKSAQDLFKAGLICLTDFASLGSREPEFYDTRRVVVQRAAIARTRPGFYAGWRAELVFSVNTPEYISPNFLREVIINAGRLVGVGDFRPTFGRYSIAEYKILED